MLPLVPLLRTGVACCLPTCVQGSSVPVTGIVENGVLGAFLLLLGALCIWWGAGVAGFTRHIHRTRVTEMCLSLDTPLWAEVGGGHYLCDLWGGLLGSL